MSNFINNQLKQQRPQGFSRPGSLTILLSILMQLPLLALTMLLIPEKMRGGGTFTIGESTAALPGILFFILAQIVVWVAYFIGSRKYLASKGYSSFWLSFFLASGQANGFLVLLLLPDRDAQP